MNDPKERLRERFDRLAPERLHWRAKNACYYREQTAFFRSLIPEGRSVLELGSGTGDLLASLRPARGLGIDISPAMVALARRRFPDLEFRVGDVEGLEDLGDPFDFIVLADLLGLLLDIEGTLGGLHPWCRKDTRIIVSYHNFLWEPLLKLGERLGLKMAEEHQNWLSMRDMAGLLELADFQTVSRDWRLLFPKEVPWLTRFVNRYVATLPILRRVCLCTYLVARPRTHAPPRDCSVSLVIPCRNERGNIAAGISRIPGFGLSQEILFVDGHSTDGTREEIQRVMALHPEKNIRLLVQEGTGKGDAVRLGFKAAGGDILMILDADLTVPPEDLPKFYRALVTGKGEFINGCRLVYPLEKESMRFLNLLGNTFFGMAFSWLLNQHIKDTLCGTKALFRKDYEKIAENRVFFGEFDPFGDFDLLFGAARLHLKILEVPIRYRERTYGETNIRRFRHGWLLLKMTLFAYKKLKRL